MEGLVGSMAIQKSHLTLEIVGGKHTYLKAINRKEDIDVLFSNYLLGEEFIHGREMWERYEEKWKQDDGSFKADVMRRLRYISSTVAWNGDKLYLIGEPTSETGEMGRD